VSNVQKAQRWTATAHSAVQKAQDSLPAGTRVYVMPMIHVHDPARGDMEFPADSFITQTQSGTVVTPPGDLAQVFSANAQVTRDPRDVEYFYVRPGESPSALLKAHARLGRIVK
jgi:hypothetical protein